MRMQMNRLPTAITAASPFLAAIALAGCGDKKEVQQETVQTITVPALTAPDVKAPDYNE